MKMTQENQPIHRLMLIMLVLSLEGLRAGTETAPPTAGLSPTPGTATPSPAAASNVKSGTPSIPSTSGTTTTATTTPTGKNGDLELTLDDLLKLDLPVDVQYVPTARDITSLYGFNYNIFEIPRSISLINRAEFDERDIQSMSDIGQFSPGTYTPTRYGIPAEPVIRGQLGDIFEDGMRDRMNQNMFPTSFNNVEALEVIKGPSTVIQSPESQGFGQVNLINKTPYYDRWQGTVRDTEGTYVPGGGSYQDNEWNVDVGGPLYKDQLAMRLSYLGRESDSYYRTAKNNTQDIYAALGYQPYDNLKIDANMQFIDDRYDELVGINRPTQALIDSRQYITGTYTGGAQYGGTIDPSTLGTSTIYPNQILLAPGDSASAKVIKGSLKEEIDVDDGLKVVNQTMGESIEQRLDSWYAYSQYVPESITLENRTQVLINADAGPGGADWEHEINVGASERYEYTKQFVEDYNEYFNAYDLTQNPNSFFIPAGNIYPGSQTPIPGTPYVANSTNFSPYDTIQSTLIDLGLFYQHRIKFDEHWSVLYGLRGDLLHAHAASLLTSPAYQDAESVLTPGWQASLMYAPNDSSLAYLTYQRATSYNSSFGAGGIGFYQTSQQINIQEMRVDNDLYELGYKWEPIKTKLFGSADIFYQQRHGLYDGYLDDIETHGIELEGIYQPLKELSLISNFTYEETNFIDYSPNGNASTANSGDFLPGGSGSPNFGGSYPTGNYRVPGQPKILYNAYLTYTHSSGFGFGLGPQVTGEQPLNIAGNVRIPAQFSWNGSIFYRKSNWEAKIDVFNFTDERNFAPVENVYPSNDLVFIQQPISAQFTLKYKF